jgi:hypothetical protein
MSIYAPKSELSHPQFTTNLDKVMSPGIETASTFTINIALAGAAQNIHFITEPWRINSDAWESGGTMSCKLRVITATNMRVRCMIRRMNSIGALLQSGTFTAFQTITGGTATFTFTPIVPTWTVGQEDCGNRLVIRFNFDALSGISAADATIEVGTIDSEITSTLTETNGNCRRINIT